MRHGRSASATYPIFFATYNEGVVIVNAGWNIHVIQDDVITDLSAPTLVPQSDKDLGVD